MKKLSQSTSLIKTGFINFFTSLARGREKKKKKKKKKKKEICLALQIAIYTVLSNQFRYKD